MNFRLSEDEYQRLMALCGKCGVRSLSEFLRSTVQWIIENGERDMLDVIGFSTGTLGAGTFRVARPGHVEDWDAATSVSEPPAADQKR